MMDTMLTFLQGIAEFSLLGCVEAVSVICIVYCIYTKTRAPAIIAGLFPKLNLTINYRSSLDKFNFISNGTLTSAQFENSESKTNSLDSGVGTVNLLESTPHAGKPYHSLLDWSAYFPFIAQTVRIKRYKFPQVSTAIEKDPLLQRAIKQAAEQILRERQYEKRPQGNDQTLSSPTIIDDDDDYQNVLKRQEKRAIHILMDMRSTLNNFLLSLTSWLLYKLLPCFLSGVVTHTQQIEMLKAATERAPGIPLIFLPLHRSHLDYVMVTFILANSDIRSPLVAAGNNLMIPVFGGLLRGLGAFFIKRKIDPVVGKKDVLYRAILQLYLQHALKMGHNVECFIEGGRTRTGKPCMPKGGILSVIVNAYMDGSIPDALLVPVSLNYERLVEGNFAREQRGETKSPESFGKAISGIWKALNSRYGLMRIDFNEPYSLRELVQSYSRIAKTEEVHRKYEPSARTLQHNHSTSSLYGTDVVCEEHRQLVDSISRQVVYDCAVATSVMSTNALAFLLLTRYRQGASDKVIAAGLDGLRTTLRGRKDIGFAGNSLHIVNYACDLLGSSIVERTQDIASGTVILRPARGVDSFIELSYYAHTLTPHFALESIVLNTFHVLLASAPAETGTALDSSENTLGVARRMLLRKALENCEVFRYEYILHRPSQQLEDVLQQTIDDLVFRDLLLLSQNGEQPGKVTQYVDRNIDDYLDESSEDVHYVDLNRSNDSVSSLPADIFLAKETIAEQRAICEVLAPIAHAYLAVAHSLNILYKNSMLESEFVKFVIHDITSKVQNGTCPYAETIAVDSVRNCMKVLEKWSVIEICNQRGLRLLSLGTLYETSIGSLKNIVQRIAAIQPNYKNGNF